MRKDSILQQTKNALKGADAVIITNTANGYLEMEIDGEPYSFGSSDKSNLGALCQYLLTLSTKGITVLVRTEHGDVPLTMGNIPSIPDQKFSLRTDPNRRIVVVPVP